jgi:uncharacterized membrane protein YkvA (DUF1232 family)
MEFFKKTGTFLKDASHDKRIPDRDKKILIGLLILIASPLDLIPDWIPVFGLMDDVVMLALILDYFFNTLDEDVLLSHYPFGMKSFIRIRRAARAVSIFAPKALKRRIWKYKASPYRS